MARPEAPAPAATSCPRCGAEVEPGQEYCLECGTRLPGGGVLAGLDERAPWLRRTWVPPVTSALLVAVGAVAFALALRNRDEDSRPTFVATTDAEVVPATTAAPRAATATATTRTVTTAATTTATQPPENPNALTAWPPGRNGYTVVLASLPKSGGRGAAVARAREALRVGVEEVGVLAPGQFASLHPAYYVVFSGVFETRADAGRGRDAARGQGYDDAYIKQVTG